MMAPTKGERLHRNAGFRLKAGMTVGVAGMTVGAAGGAGISEGTLNRADGRLDLSG